ncbi:MAG: ribosome assembly factor SBDS [Nanoarchaeota archaeon]|nr:ribosome assembly factor SBDS [Nanoarchaeota archaeon]
MTQTTARIKKNGMDFEILVDLDEALKFKKGESASPGLEIDRVFSDLKKGFKAAEDDLEVAFGTTDANEIAKIIVKQGEVLTDQAHRDEEKEKKMKQVIDFLATNASDPQSGRPHTPERIKSALEQAHVNIKNVPVENQIKEIIEALNSIIPIKIQTKKFKITIPAIQTGKAYGVVAQYKEKEEWLNNGDLEVILSIPSGIVIDFFEKLNGVTHGSAISEEIKE